jgi:hypothetical protein
VSKVPNDFGDKFQDLKGLYQELLALRLRVHQAERISAERVTVGPKAKTTGTARRKPQRGKPSK